MSSTPAPHLTQTYAIDVTFGADARDLRPPGTDFLADAEALTVGKSSGEDADYRTEPGSLTPTEDEVSVALKDKYKTAAPDLIRVLATHKRRGCGGPTTAVHWNVRWPWKASFKFTTGVHPGEIRKV